MGFVVDGRWKTGVAVVVGTWTMDEGGMRDVVEMALSHV